MALAAVTGATVADTLPAALTGVTWTCAGAACPAASGSGNLAATLGALASAATVTFAITGNLASSATGSLSNTATTYSGLCAEVSLRSMWWKMKTASVARPVLVRMGGAPL